MIFSENLQAELLVAVASMQHGKISGRLLAVLRQQSQTVRGIRQVNQPAQMVFRCGNRFAKQTLKQREKVGHGKSSTWQFEG
jgi:hypothetical protein